MPETINTQEPELKKCKTEMSSTTPSIESSTTTPSSVQTCKHFVHRKKRFCKMTVAKNQEYCGEHLPVTDLSQHEDSYISQKKKDKRIPCPLDAKHTVYHWNLEKHLKICNAKQKPHPAFIEPGINLGLDHVEEPSTDNTNKKISEIDCETLTILIKKIEKIFAEHIEGNINEMYLNHNVMETELNNPVYGHETRKHLIQTSSILGSLNKFELLKNNTSFIEFGAGKGQVSFWLAQIIKDLSLENSNVILIDRASLRHKKDNKIEDRNVVHRIRADIADLVIKQLDECKLAKQIVGVSKHLCGGATDLAIRCFLNDERNSILGSGIVIALCCHHRCTWKPFVGKEFLQENQITPEDFVIMTKMVSWAICGSGMSRETREAIKNKNIEGTETINKEPSDEVNDTGIKSLTRQQKEVIGIKCKRILDFARCKYLNALGYKSSLNYFVKSDVTLENVCLVSMKL